MAVVTLPTVAVDATAGGIEIASAGESDQSGVSFTLYNNGPNTAYIGGSSLTALKGIPLPAAGRLNWVLDGGETLKAICAAAETAVIRVVKQSA